MPSKRRRLSPECVSRDFEKTEKSIEEYRNEILMHVREKDKLEKNIPASIVIGPYYVFAQKLRESLSNKRKALIEALLLSQTRKARTKTEEVRDHRKHDRSLTCTFLSSSSTIVSVIFNVNSTKKPIQSKIFLNIVNG